MSLIEVTSVKETGEECHQDWFLFDVGIKKVVVKATRSRVKVVLLSTLEELRLRDRLTKVRFEVVCAQHPQRL